MNIVRLSSCFALFGGVFLLGSGCGGDAEETDPTGSGGAGGSGSVTTVSSTVSSTSTMSGPTTTGMMKPDESTNCGDALELEPATNTLMLPFFQYDGGAIDPAGDTDFFKFTVANDGDWWSIGTDANPDGKNDMIDTVMTLYNETGEEQLAQNNYAPYSSSDDSELNYRFVKAGTYCLKIEDSSTAFDGQTPEGGPSFMYRVYAVPIDFPQYPQHNLDAEPNGTVMEAQAMTVSEGTSGITDYGYASGTFSAKDDIDMFSMARRDGTNTFYVYFAAKGEGSSMDPDLVRVRDQDGNILSEVNVAEDIDNSQRRRIWAAISPTATSLIVEVNGEEVDEIGGNPFYHIQTRSTDYENPQEVEPNDDSMSASIAVGQVNSGNTMLYSHYIGGTLNSEDISSDATAWGADTDWWSFQAQQGQNIILTCTSVRGGTGLISPTFSIYREGDLNNPLQTESESKTKNLYWAQSTSASKPKIVVNQTGNYYLKIEGADRDPNVLTTNYACGIHVESP
ncbi:MAG: DVUA0089 family protein [Polyangiaceae bacterium]